MSVTFTIIGIIGGVFTILGAATAIIRNIVKNVGATEDNTKATQTNTDAIAILTAKVGELGSKVDGVYLRQAIQADRLSLIERKIGQNGRT